MSEIDWKSLVAVIRALFGLPSDADEAIEARLKHMQRERFPNREFVGRGRRRTYAIVDVLKVAVALQLVDAGLSSALAVKMVGHHWDAIAAVLRRAVKGDRRTPAVALMPNVILDLSETASKTWMSGRCLELTRPLKLPAYEVGIAPSIMIIVDPLILIPSVKRAIGRLKGIAIDEIEDAFAVFSRTPKGTAGG
jgi:hypothetical protein